MHGVYQLACLVREQFEPGTMFLWNAKPSSIRISGLINLSHGNVSTGHCAHVSISIDDGWKRTPPLATAFDPWLRRGVDWHTSKYGGSLCYVFDGHWGYSLAQLARSNDEGLAKRYAAAWCLGSIRWLLYRHLFAFENGISRWQSEWGGWPHNPDTAWAELEKLKRKGHI